MSDLAKTTMSDHMTYPIILCEGRDEMFGHTFSHVHLSGTERVAMVNQYHNVFRLWLHCGHINIPEKTQKTLIVMLKS